MDASAHPSSTSFISFLLPRNTRAICFFLGGQAPNHLVDRLFATLKSHEMYANPYEFPRCGRSAFFGATPAGLGMAPTALTFTPWSVEKGKRFLSTRCWRRIRRFTRKFGKLFLSHELGWWTWISPFRLASQKRSSIGILQGRYQHPSIGLIGFDRDLTGTSWG